MMDLKNFDAVLVEHPVNRKDRSLSLSPSRVFSPACNRVESARACKAMRTDGAA